MRIVACGRARAGARERAKRDSHMDIISLKYNYSTELLPRRLYFYKFAPFTLKTSLRLTKWRAPTTINPPNRTVK
jgi:hypothetical protein